MAKLTRNNLKSLVKECLVEIFSEVGTQLVESPSSTTRKRARVSKSKNSSEDRRLQKMRQILDERHVENSGPSISETVSAVTNDPLLSKILADTAQSTLMEQNSAESYGESAMQGDAASRAMATADPIDLFGDAADKWTSLAFSEKKGI